MPVRVKQRALSHLESDKKDEKEFLILKRQLIALLLGLQRPVSLALTGSDIKGGRLYIRMNDVPKLQRPAVNTNELCLGPAGSDPARIIETSMVCSILSQAAYIEPVDWDSWIKTSARTPAITARGVISLKPSPSKQVQFLSLGIRPVFSEASGNLLYDEINRLFAASSFGNQEEPEELEEDERLDDSRYKLSGCTSKQLKGRGKGVDKWPKFYIRIDLEGDNDTERLERENVLSDVLKVVGAMVHGFLKNNHFRPRKRVKCWRPPTPKVSATPSRISSATDIFSSWSRIKCGRQSMAVSSRTLPTKPESTSVEEAQPASSQQISESSPQPASTYTVVPATGDQEQMFEWTNPVSKAKVLVNSRTGLVMARPSAARRPSTAPATLPSSSYFLPPRKTRRLSASQGAQMAGSWVNQLLSNWENPVFALPEESIPQVNLDGPHVETLYTVRGAGNCYSDGGVHSPFAQSTNTLSTKLSKKALIEARIISQVDKKFILASMGEETQVLVLVDQHAADERIRVEALIDELSTQAPIKLQKPITFEVACRDREVIERHSSYFLHWGIQYQIVNPANCLNSKLAVTALPQSIAERCRIEPRVLIDLLRGEAWNLEETSNAPALHTPPQGLLDLLNSRACRSAIMFNDPLEIEEAETLISRLAQTKLPFQCAHGRPSMVPLVDLGKPGQSDPEGPAFPWRKGGRREVEETFVTAWKRWQGQESGVKDV